MWCSMLYYSVCGAVAWRGGRAPPEEPPFGGRFWVDGMAELRALGRERLLSKADGRVARRTPHSCKRMSRGLEEGRGLEEMAASST